MKTTEAIFKANARNGKFLWHNIYDLERFLLENEGVELWCVFKQANKLSEKYKMYAYWHGPLLECAVNAYTRAGYSGIDKVKADYLLRAEFAKDFILKPDGSTQVIMLDKSGMTKARLLKLLQDSIQFLEQEMETECPDSEEWKIKKETGRNFKEIK